MPRRFRARARERWAVGLCVALGAPLPLAVAAEPSAAGAESGAAEAPPAPRAVRLCGSVEVGAGLRLNNPYRLATPLGASYESVALTSSYLDLGFGAAFGAAGGLQHGAALHLSVALAGVGQQILTPSYFLAYRGASRFLGYGRFGPSVVLTPSTTWGAEAAAGFAWFFVEHVGLGAELVGDLYYGAGTPEVGVVAYPVLSGQLGFVIDWELVRR